MRFNARNAEHFFVSSVLFTEEGRFGRDSFINIHNHHQGSDENPHGVLHFRDQQYFNINMWAGIVGDYLVGPHVFPHRLTWNHYGDFLLHGLQTLLEIVPPAVIKVWNMHYDAPAHFIRVVRDVLITPIITKRCVEEDQLRDLHSRQI
jgi:hypothetical protein